MLMQVTLHVTAVLCRAVSIIEYCKRGGRAMDVKTGSWLNTQAKSPCERYGSEIPSKFRQPLKQPACPDCCLIAACADGQERVETRVTGAGDLCGEQDTWHPLWSC